MISDLVLVVVVLATSLTLAFWMERQRHEAKYQGRHRGLSRLEVAVADIARRLR